MTVLTCRNQDTGKGFSLELLLTATHTPHVTVA